MTLFTANPWTEEQTNYLRMRCADWMKCGRVMRKSEVEMVKDEVPELFEGRNWIAIKNKVRVILQARLTML